MDKVTLGIKVVPMKNNINVYKAAKYICGVFPLQITDKCYYELKYNVSSNTVQLEAYDLTTGQLVTACNMMPASVANNSNFVYLASMPKHYYPQERELKGFFVGFGITKQSEVTQLKLQNLAVVQAKEGARGNRDLMYHNLSMGLLRISCEGSVSAPEMRLAMYRMNLMKLANLPPPQVVAAEMTPQWVCEFARAPDSVKRQISKIMRMFAWQIKIHIPKEDRNSILHYGVFPVSNDARTPSLEQIDYLTKMFSPE